MNNCLSSCYSAITGNSRLLVCFNHYGQITRLFWPSIDFAQHLGVFRCGLWWEKDGRRQAVWLQQPQNQPQLYYQNDTAVLVQEEELNQPELTARTTIFVLPEADVLVKRFIFTSRSSEPLSLYFFVYLAPLLAESEVYDCVYFDYNAHSLVFFRRDIYLTLGAHSGELVGFQCGRQSTPSDPLALLAEGRLNGNQDNMRLSAGSLAWRLEELNPGQSCEFTVYLIAGANREVNRQLLYQLRTHPPEELEKKAVTHWQHFLASCRVQPSDKRWQSFYRRSLVTIKLLTSEKTGASIAAPEFDPYYRECGGYGYCWGRDATYTAIALAEAGYLELASQFYLFMAAIQSPDGSWRQRYFSDGISAPTWGKQIDQTGIILWGYRHYYHLSKDKNFLQKIWPSLEKGAEHLIFSLAPNGLPQPSMDLWEDEYIQSTYSSAAAYGGLKAAADIALILGYKEKAARWQQAAESIRTAILQHQWSASCNRFIRGVYRRVDRHHYEKIFTSGGKTFVTTDYTGLYPVYLAASDERIDSALLGLAFPFGVLKATDPRMVATARAIERELKNANVGGIHRYSGDSYRGGNPWLITTFWLAIYLCLLGETTRATSLYEWCLAQANPLQLLPEQADREQGGPAWVLPLTWSHAMQILASLALEGKLTAFELLP